MWNPRCRSGWPPSIASRAGRAFGFGALLAGVNPKNLALTLAAAATIAKAGLDGGETAIAVAVFVIIGSLTVAGPVLYYLFAGDRAAGPLAGIKEFMSDHNAVIMMILLLVLGMKLIGEGIAGLTDSSAPMSDRIRLSSAALDCPNARELAAFYADITGGRVTFEDHRRSGRSPVLPVHTGRPRGVDDDGAHSGVV